jgi:hypothetical protein
MKSMLSRIFLPHQKEHFLENIFDFFVGCCGWFADLFVSKQRDIRPFQKPLLLPI